VSPTIRRAQRSNLSPHRAETGVRPHSPAMNQRRTIRQLATPAAQGTEIAARPPRVTFATLPPWRRGRLGDTRLKGSTGKRRNIPAQPDARDRREQAKSVWSGRYWDRTSGLCRVKVSDVHTARPSDPGNRGEVPGQRPFWPLIVSPQFSVLSTVMWTRCGRVPEPV